MTTQNCAECGTRAEPGQSFCDACGAVLSWKAPVPAARATSTRDESREEERTARTGTARTGTAPPARTGTHAYGDATPRNDRGAEPGRAAGVAEPGRATGVDVRGSRQTAYDESAPAEPVPTPAPTTPPPAAPAAPASTSQPPPYDTMADRARSLLVPVSEPEGRPADVPSVAPVLPGRPVADRPQVRAPGHEAGEGNGLPCPWCATPNRPDRHFCARCAMPMTRQEERSRVRLPWWRRLLNSRGGETPWAGDRPRMRRTFDSVLRWVFAAVVLALLIVAGTNAPTAVQATRDHFAKRAPVAPDGFGASRSFQGHPPTLAFDKFSNTWWGPGIAQSGEGEWIEARFDEPTRLLDLIVTPGVSSKANRIGESALPHRLKATITTKDGRHTTRTLTLDQGPGGQRRAFRVGDVTKVRFTVESAYGASAGKQVALAEIEFFGPSRGDSA
ncbi:zinc ribbon domain-containing protein [Streptomyces sp. NPDC048442]|uniref:NADase-type glycan-binding domain-containing protein n=1 Tax=Streptomyces sp. NPDC048442 TaxID=3154823 RepID=UPI0034408B81